MCNFIIIIIVEYSIRKILCIIIQQWALVNATAK